MGETESADIKRILLVDDHELVRHGMAELLDAEPDFIVCGGAADAPTAMSLVESTHPHVAVIDLTLRKGSGLDLIKQIKAADSTVKMVVCSMHDDRLYAERVLRAGAMGYVNKQEPSERILQAIRQVLDGKVFVDEGIVNRVLQRVANCEPRSPQSAVETLSDRELEVLQLIGDGLTTRQIADRLHLSIKTIDTYREHLKSKLDLESAIALLRYAVAWSLNPCPDQTSEAEKG